MKFSHKNKLWAGVLLAQFLFFSLLSRTKTAVKIAEHFFEMQKSAHQKLFAGFGFSIGDIAYIFLLFLIIWNLFLVLKKNRRRQAISNLLTITNLLVFLYYIFWGMLYFEEPLMNRFPKTTHKISIEQATAFYLKKCIAERVSLPEDLNGVFTISDKNALKNAVILAQRNIPEKISGKNSTGIVSLKPSIFGKLMSYTGISGYYNPFSAEAQFDANIPASELPFTLGHEAAHQLGYAREEEASFVGWITESRSEDISLLYSADLFALKSLLAAQAEKNPNFVKRILGSYSAGMQRDRASERKFIADHSGLANAFFSMTNDLFLKSNRQDGAVNYSYFTDLLLRYMAASDEKGPN